MFNLTIYPSPIFPSVTFLMIFHPITYFTYIILNHFTLHYAKDFSLSIHISRVERLPWPWKILIYMINVLRRIIHRVEVILSCNNIPFFSSSIPFWQSCPPRRTLELHRVYSLIPPYRVAHTIFASLFSPTC